MTLRQVARSADACNIGPVVTGGVNTPEEAHHKLRILRRHCERLDIPYEDILKTHFTLWLMLAEDQAGVQGKLARCFPDGLDAIWQPAVVAGTPQQVVSYLG